MGFYLLLRLGLLSARVLPYRRFADLCARLGRIVGRFSPSRATVAANLAAIEGAGGPHAEPGEVFASYGRYWGELLALATRPERAERLHLRILGMEHLRAARSRGPVCGLSAHMGNWEVLAHWVGKEIPDMAYLVERLHPPRLFRLFREIRGALACHTLAAEGGGRELFRHLASGGSVGLVSDRVIGAGWREAQFFGGRRDFPSAGMDLARRAGATLLPMFIRREGPGFVIRIHPPLAEEEDPVAGFARALESELIAAPEQWCVLYPLHDTKASTQSAFAARKAVAS